MDNLALYSISYFNWNTNDGVFHILQAGITYGQYDENRRQLVEKIGEEKVSEVEEIYSTSLDRYREFM